MKTLLQKFIDDKLKWYREPTRKGTAHGQPVGLSRVKYHAALLCALTDRKQKDIAEELGVSHGLLRKWRTESLFKKEVEREERLFLGHVRLYIEKEFAPWEKWEPISEDELKALNEAMAKFERKRKEGKWKSTRKTFEDFMAELRGGKESPRDSLQDASSYSRRIKSKLLDWAHETDEGLLEDGITPRVTNILTSSGIKPDEDWQHKFATNMVSRSIDILRGKESLESNDIYKLLKMLYAAKRYLEFGRFLEYD